MRWSRMLSRRALLLLLSALVAFQPSQPSFAFGRIASWFKKKPAPKPTPKPTTTVMYDFNVQTLDGDPWKPIAGSTITVTDNARGTSVSGSGNAVGIAGF